MAISHDVLLSLGFRPDLTRADRYTYQGIPGKLVTSLGVFILHGFNIPIQNASDLKYVQMLIDYQHQAGPPVRAEVPYPNEVNN